MAPSHSNASTNKSPLKKSLGSNLCSSYRPLSLINVDTKTLAKDMAHHLENIILTIVSQEKTGFVKT